MKAEGGGGVDLVKVPSSPTFDHQSVGEMKSKKTSGTLPDSGPERGTGQVGELRGKKPYGCMTLLGPKKRVGAFQGGGLRKSGEPVPVTRRSLPPRSGKK